MEDAVRDTATVLGQDTTLDRARSAIEAVMTRMIEKRRLEVSELRSKVIGDVPAKEGHVAEG